MGRDSSREIAGSSTEATRWIVQLDSAKAVYKRWPGLLKWLNDPANRNSFESADEFWRQLEALRDPRLQEEAAALIQRWKQKRAARSRAWRVWGLGAAGTFAAVIGFYILRPIVGIQLNLQSSRPMYVVYATSKGSQEIVVLSDRSEVQLNANTQIEVSLTPRWREVRLLRGEALFRVSKDPDRVFEVKAGPAAVRAVGTIFAVKLRNEGSAETVVQQGVVDLLSAGHVQRLAQGQVARATAAGIEMQQSESSSVDGRLSWTTGQLMFLAKPLSQVTEEFNRYNERQLVIRDSELADLPVSGTFEANDPDRLAAALELKYGIRHSVDPFGAQGRGVINLSRRDPRRLSSYRAGVRDSSTADH